MKKITKADIIRKSDKFLVGYDLLQKDTIRDKDGEEISYKYICKNCSCIVDSIIVEYSRKGALKGQVSKEVKTYFCGKCDRYFLSDYWVHQINSLADLTESKLQIIPELGISSCRELELYCEVIWNEEEHQGELSIEEEGINISIGNQSKLFQEALDLITDYDISDYGHDMSETFRITPGLPYSPSQRKTITTLISKLQTQINGQLDFWTINFIEDFIEQAPNIYNDLSKLLIEWDDDRVALSILNEIYTGKGPGRFINVFRLLEYILHICLLREIDKERFNEECSAQQFSELTNQFQLDLKTKLKRRIELLDVPPIEILQSLWHRICFNKPYDEKHVYEKIIRFRNSLAHKPDKDISAKGIQLPWEEPPFVGFTNDMLKLVHRIVKEN